MINMCMPHHIFERVQDDFKIRGTEKNKNNKFKDIYKETIEKKLLNTQLEMRILLGKTKISVEEFVDLRSGDVILLDSKINDPLETEVGGKVRFTVRPGIFNNKVAGQVVDYYRKDIMEDE